MLGTSRSSSVGVSWLWSIVSSGDMQPLRERPKAPERKLSHCSTHGSGAYLSLESCTCDFRGGKIDTK